MSSEWCHLEMSIYGHRMPHAPYRSHIADTTVAPGFNLEAHNTKLMFCLCIILLYIVLYYYFFII